MRCTLPIFLAPVFFAGISLIPRQAGAQGCVAGRCPVGLVQTRPSGLDISAHPASGWQASIGYRWLHSDRQYVGSDYQEQVTAQNRQFINDLNNVDLGLTYSINPRWSVSLTVPWVDNSRSSPIRGGDGTVIGRSEVSASGMGDIRVSANYWLWDPSAHPASEAPEPTGKGKAPIAHAPQPGGRRGNVRVSIGVDMPTGEKDARDYRSVYNSSSGQIQLDPIPRIVDQSIQPGDGGWGIPIDLYAYYNFTDRVSGYFQSSYLITPEGQNGVLSGSRAPGETIMSIGDTWMARAGLEYVLLPQHGVSVSLGLRSEGQPSEDLFGSSLGFRRPGMNMAVEPGITWMKNGWTASLLWPITYYNNRFQSEPEHIVSAATGRVRHGDAAFAQSYVMFVIGRQF